MKCSRRRRNVMKEIEGSNAGYAGVQIGKRSHFFKQNYFYSSFLH